MHRLATAALLVSLVGWLGAGDALAAAQPTATAPPRTVTLADDGRTIGLVVGERFLLALGDQFDWTVRVADPGVVGRVVNVTVVRGAQGLYEARQPGATALEATGDPPCRKAQPPCGAPSRLFRVQLRVAAAAPLPGLPNTGGGAPERGRPPVGWLVLAGLPALLGGLWRARRARRRHAPAVASAAPRADRWGMARRRPR